MKRSIFPSFSSFKLKIIFCMESWRGHHKQINTFNFKLGIEKGKVNAKYGKTMVFWWDPRMYNYKGNTKCFRINGPAAEYILFCLICI
jgi:hypothetical protein